MNNADPEQLAQQVRHRSLRVRIMLFPEVEILDFAGPYEVFSVASRVAQRDGLLPHPAFVVEAVSGSRSTVSARHGLGMVPDVDFDDAAAADVLIVPGGVVAQPLNDPASLGWLQRACSEAGIVASVCTGAFLLARIGLLTNQRVTTHWEDIPGLRSAYPELDVVESVPFVDLGNLLTSAGISAGIDMSLHLVGRILGPKAAKATARQMQYAWEDS
ncbi:DJ-1/PfpI family protein [Halopseudomonas xinjiangensis]|uniref:DJ-1/PfpI family protein n=1 Tax=Halopseudomonas xinjiangensis TaxID=487184 RepID=A0A1H1TXQ2_9GAMM|nr:DJ-1/PfpI family protein [Halopseudomonas xinjiangensis]SDS65035.1 DJ-1/PfpI family protein [Halopseudomonas xinjiangensis]